VVVETFRILGPTSADVYTSSQHLGANGAAGVGAFALDSRNSTAALAVPKIANIASAAAPSTNYVSAGSVGAGLQWVDLLVPGLPAVLVPDSEFLVESFTAIANNIWWFAQGYTRPLDPSELL
jgi:hypothetical protein